VNGENGVNDLIDWMLKNPSKAANEMEFLRAEVERQRQQIAGIYDDMKWAAIYQESEIERLRANCDCIQVGEVLRLRAALDGRKL